MSDREEIRLTPLVAAILQDQLSLSHSTTDRLIESLQSHIKRLETERAIIEDRIYALCGKPWAPNPDVIRRALIVTSNDVEDWQIRNDCDE